MLMCDRERGVSVEVIKVLFYSSNSVDPEMEGLWLRFD